MRTIDKFWGDIGAEQFFADYFGKQPLLIKGQADAVAGLMDSQKLERLLGMPGIWSADSLKLAIDRQRIPTEQYCQQVAVLGGGHKMQPDPAQVANWIAKGASVIANQVDELDLEVMELVSSLEQKTGGRVQANAYFSRKQRQAFSPHFDTHHVFAVHCQSYKTWRVYQNREPNPIAHPMFQSFSNQELDSRKGPLVMEANMEPGDLLYIPRGQYHDAIATDDESIHLALGLNLPTGVEVMTYLYEHKMLSDEAFRAELPLISGADHSEALGQHMAALGRKMQDFFSEPQVKETVTEKQQKFPRKRSGFKLER